MEAYLSMLDMNDDLSRQCERLMTVSISRFFRDRVLWQTIQQTIFPALIDNNEEKIKVWSAGCACGEEVYSLRIIWDSMKKCFVNLPSLEIIATDMNPDYLDRACAGIYSFSSLREVSEELRAIYFETGDNGRLYTVKSLLRKDITWKLHNLFSDPPGSDFHVILLRNNLLTYYQNRPKETVFRKVMESLLPHGFLIIGLKESLPFETEDLIPFDSCPCVFRKDEKEYTFYRLSRVW